MKETRLTPFEALLWHALKTHGELTYEEMMEIEPPRPTPLNKNNKFAVHMQSIRRKLGARIAVIRGVGYRLES